MKVGIIRFPGSNCDFDTLKFFQGFGHKPEFIWHKDTIFYPWDLLVLPGGFAFGDRVYKKATGRYHFDPGILAIKSPAIKIVHEFAKRRLPILGICNGFQILVKAGLLPGRLKQNKLKKFFCNFTSCKITGRSFFGYKKILGKKVRIPIAHGYGKYTVSPKTYRQLVKNKQVILKFVGFNPNGSYKNIAGVCNREGNIFGLMPHPERTPDGKYFMQAIENYVKNKI